MLLELALAQQPSSPLKTAGYRRTSKPILEEEDQSRPKTRGDDTTFNAL
jgi:hypothetical protein